MKFFLKRREYKAYRYFRLTLSIAAAILAATIVSTLTVDLGPALRARAEQAASARLERGVRIGELHVHVFTGRFAILADDERVRVFRKPLELRVDDRGLDGAEPLEPLAG